MAKAELIDGHVSLKQCKTAVDALQGYNTKKEKELEETQLLPGREQHVWLQITVKKMHTEKKIKPVKVPIKHPIVDPRTSPVCLISKDPQREYKDLLESHNIKFVSRVVGIEKLKGKFKPFEARRMLLKENDLFLADERVIPLLPKLLGRKWFDAKKQPIPVCMTRKDLKAELERAIESTYMHQNMGTCTSVKVARASQSTAHILDNLKLAIPGIVKHIKGGWENIQSLYLKSNSSVSLPIWTCDLGDGEGGRWDSVTVEDAAPGVKDGESDAEADDDEEEVKKAPKPALKASKEKEKKKRALDTTGDDVKPKKKVKSSVELPAGPPKAVVETSTKPSSKKAKKSKDSSDTPSIPLTPASEKPKSKKPAPAAEPETADSTPISAPQPSSSKKAKKADQPPAAEPPKPEKASSKPKTNSKALASAALPDSTNAPAAPAPVQAKAKAKNASELGSEELKQKRSQQGAQKKKDKVLAQRPGKAAKSGVLGKRVSFA